MKTLIAVPCMSQVNAEFCSSLAMMQKEGQCVLEMKIGSLIYDARNSLCSTAIKIGADYILWLDADMVFPSDLLPHMMRVIQENDNIDILTGVYYRRTEPYTPVLFKCLEQETDGQIIWSGFDEVPEGLTEVGGCGFGCVLMPTDIIFDITAKHGTLFTPFPGAGEDVAFCIRARESGFHIYADPSIKLGHTGYVTITEDFFRAYKGQNNG